MATSELKKFEVVDVELMPVAKPKPAVTGNQLGTLAQAVAA